MSNQYGQLSSRRWGHPTSFVLLFERGDTGPFGRVCRHVLTRFGPHQALEGKDVKDLLLNVGSGGGAAPAAAGASAAAGGGDAAAESKEEAKEEGKGWHRL